MPYRSKVDRERPLWMTLEEAFAHIQAHLAQESCDPLGAETQVRMACGEGEIPLRWAADPPPQGFYFFGSPPLFAADEVPTDPRYWSQVLIFGDRVVDQSFSFLTEADSAPERAPRQRGLFLLRSRVLELWPLRDDKGKDRSTDQPKKRAATDGQIVAAARELYEQMRDKPPNLTKAEKLLADRLPGTPRKIIRPILKQREFANLRLPRGNQPKS
jgi:hypothetical protein